MKSYFKIFILIIFSSAIFFCNVSPRYVEIKSRKFIQNISDETSSYYSYPNLTINLNKTALVLIDIWDNEPRINELIKYRLVPLLKLARKKNITIIHAPSQNFNIHPLCRPMPGEIVVNGYKNIDNELKLREINTILYAGFDTYKCVLDKPMGIFSTKERNPQINLLLIRDCTLSGNVISQTVATNMIEKHFGHSTSLENLYYALDETPPDIILNDLTIPESSISENQIPENATFSSNNSALVLTGTGAIDSYPSGSFKDRISPLQNDIENLIDFARNNNLLIIHAPNEYGNLNSRTPLSNEPIIYSKDSFINTIENNNIKNLFYAGFAVNEDILFGNAGIVSLYIRGRYENIPVPGYYIINNCTFAFEMPETLSGEYVKEVSLTYRNIQTLTYNIF
ncbi:hypothetical protein ACFL20_03310, partial [Spirochaetota bacterium]